MKIKLHTTNEMPFGFTTTGYWRFTEPNNKGTLEIYVAKFTTRRFWLAVAGHELIESLYCKVRGVTTEAADAWDNYYESGYRDGTFSKSGEPGHDPKCPYHWGHMAGVVWEYLCIYGTFSSWTAYGDACNSVMGIESVPATCEHCPHRDYDETPDGENMWSWCKHPSVPTGDPYYGRMSLDDEHGCGKPLPYCPLRIPPRPPA